MNTRTPIPLQQTAFLTPSGRVSEPWRQYLLALGDQDGNAGPDLGPILVALAEIRQQDSSFVPVVFESSRTSRSPVDVPVPALLRSPREPSEALVPVSYGLSTQTDAGLLSPADKAKLDSLLVITPQSLTTDVTASNTAADVVVLTETLAANIARVGMQRRFTMYALVSNGTTAGTLQLWVKVGSTKVFTHTFTSPTTAATNKGLYVGFEWCFRAIGTSGLLQVSGTLFTNDTPAVTLTPDSLATPAAINTTTAQTFTFGFNWLAANASNSITAKSASLVGVV